MVPPEEFAEPLLAEPKFRDGDSSEDWEPEPRTSQRRTCWPWLAWILSTIVTVLFTSAVTYLVVKAHEDLDKACSLYTSVWCRLALISMHNTSNNW